MDMVARQGMRARAMGVPVVAAFVGFTIFLVLSDSEPADTGAWIYVAVSGLIAAAVWWFGVAKPLERATGNTPAKVGLVLGILALASNVMFWAGYNALLGGAALLLGLEGARRAEGGEGRAGMSKAATILGGLSIAAFVVIWVAFGVAELF